MCQSIARSHASTSSSVSGRRQASLDGDEQAAEAAVRRHIRRSMAKLDELPDETFGPDSLEQFDAVMQDED
jgi:hypothetical protein